MSDRNLMAGCPSCHARVGEPCRVQKPHARSRWVEGVHATRWNAAREAAEWATEERTARYIAAWLEARGDDCNPIRSAQLIRDGAWRRTRDERGG